MAAIGDFDIGNIRDILEVNWDEIFDEFEDDKDANENQDGKPVNKRFKTTDDKGLEQLILGARSKQTVYATSWGVKILKQWLQFNELSQDFEHLPAEKLSALLRRFYAEIRNAEGNFYSKSSFVGIRAAIHRHLRQPPFEREFNLLRDKEFQTANNVFNAMLKQIKQMGLDNPTHHAPISEVDLVKIRQNQRVDNAADLQKKVWFDLTLGFGKRGRENQANLKQSSFAVDSDENGCKFIKMTHSEATKNHPGGVTDKDDSPRARVYETNTSSCPVASFLKYVGKLNPENPSFFQQPLKNVREDESVWYGKKPVGHNTISSFMKDMSKRFNLGTIYTNHCVRATTVTLLSHAGVEAREIVKITGHKNFQSLASYNADSSSAQKRQYSEILQNPKQVLSTVNNFSQSSKSNLSGFLHISGGNVVVHNHFHSGSNHFQQ